MTKRRSTYTREFKLGIIAQVESGIPIAQVARENGLHPELVSRWKAQYKENPEKAFSGHGNPYKDQARIAELERTVGRLYSENEFLKKTLETLKTRVDEKKRRWESGSDTK